MSLRSSTENENGGISLRGVLTSTRHSRAGGNPGWFSAELAWIPAPRSKSGTSFAGMTEPRRPLRSADYPRMRIFEGGHEEHEVRSLNYPKPSCPSRLRGENIFQENPAEPYL